jgi:hypothetical protein
MGSAHSRLFSARALSTRTRFIALGLIGGVLAGSAVTAVTSAATAKILINTGGAAVTDVDGNHWQADAYSTGGQTSSTTATVSGTQYQSVFQNDRYGMSAYRIPVTNGTYTVKLLEAEHYFTTSGQRIFDVTAEGALKVDNLDVFAKAGGKNKAVYIIFTATVTDGKLDLVFTASKNTAKVDGIVVEPTAGSPPPPAASVMWGMDDTSTYDSTENSLGRKFALARQYRKLDEAYGTSRQQALANSGHSLVVSIRAMTSAGWIKYPAITSGKYDATLAAGLAKLNALPTVTYVIFQHEPDANISKPACTNTADSVCGPEFVAAWKHVYNLSKARGFTRLKWAWTVTSYGFSPQTNVRNNYYWPGSSYTDWIGVDAYNGGCNGNWYGTFSEMLDKSITWIKSKAPNKPIMVPEWGATEGTKTTDKPNFFNDIPAALQQPGYTNIKALTYWNNKPSNCDFRITTTTASFNAYKSLGLKPLMGAKAPVS